MLKHILTASQAVLWGGGLLTLAACSPEADTSTSSNTVVANETIATPEPQQVADAEEQLSPSEFLSSEMHSIDPVAPGTFRFEIADEVHSGEISGDCGWIMQTAEGESQDRFQFHTNWQAEDGRSMYVSLRRFVSHDDFFWNSYHGHENDNVQVRLREDGGNLGSFDSTAHSSMTVLRARPGDTPLLIRGSGEMPAVRIAPDGKQVSAIGELEGPDSDYGTPLVGPFTLAIHCDEETG